LWAWPVNNPGICSLYFEPYWLFVDQPEQKIEFLGDASAILGTLGMSADFGGKHFECGFDTSMNFGHQNVKNWDKNSTRFTNFDGINRIANSKVTYNNPQDTTDPLNGKDFPFVAGSTSQTMIEQSPQSENQNGKVIGTTTFNGNTVELINKSDRFKKGYENKLRGWMFVTDGSWWNNQHDLQLAVTFGFASGDNNPNLIDEDGIYSGFIGFQELYSGRRVKSAYVLGSSRLRRPLSFPLSFPRKGKFASAVGRFTNLIFTGGSIYWRPNSYEGKLKFHPNMIFYWDDLRTRAYDLEAGAESNSFSSRFLGTEFSLFVDYYLKPPLRLFFVAGIFVPGAHFTDIQGKPINANQSKIIEELLRRRDKEDRTGYSEELIPNISDDTGLILNFGIEYKF